MSPAPKILLAALGLGLASSACTVKTVDRPVTVTTKLLPEAAHADATGAGQEVSGSSCNRVVLLFIPVGFATAERAYADALAQAPGADALVRYEARQRALFVFPFYYEVCSEVHGYAANSKSLVGP
jgi:hypothetical protein